MARKIKPSDSSDITAETKKFLKSGGKIKKISIGVSGENINAGKFSDGAYNNKRRGKK